MAMIFANTHEMPVNYQQSDPTVVFASNAGLMNGRELRHALDDTGDRGAFGLIRLETKCHLWPH